MGVSGLVSRGSRAAGEFGELIDRVSSAGHRSIAAEFRSISVRDVQAAAVVISAYQATALPVAEDVDRDENAGGLAGAVGVPGDWGCR